MKRVLKALAISFGGGLALGAGIRIGQASVKTRPRPEAETDPLLHPLMQRLDAVEARIVRVESSARAHSSAGFVSPAPAAANFSGEDLQAVSANLRNVDRKIEELESRLPGLIRGGVAERVDEVYVTLRREIEEVHNRAVQALVDTLQNQVMQRMSIIEGSLTEQSKAIGDLRQSSMRTDQSLQKMLAGIEQLRDQSKPPSRPLAGIVSEPREESGVRSHEAAASAVSSSVTSPVASAPRTDREESSARPHSPSFELIEARPVSARRWRTPLIVAMAGVVMLSGFGLASRIVRKRFIAPQAFAAPVSTVAASDSTQSAVALLEQGRDYARRQEWVQAENAYRSVLQANPQNREAALGLTDVLYQQHKYEESAAVLNRLSTARL
jgi:hypothetical protein